MTPILTVINGMDGVTTITQTSTGQKGSNIF